MGMLRMLDDSIQLLASQEAREPARVGVSIGHEARHSTTPLDALGAREEILEQLVLTAENHIDMPASQTGRTSALRDAVEAHDGFLSIFLCH